VTEKQFNTVVSFNFSVDHDGDEPTIMEIITEFTSRVNLIDLKDPEIYRRIQEGDTVGFFQDDFEKGDTV
jgi:hypothetical protein